MTLKTGRRSPSQNVYDWHETGMYGENWCHRLKSPIFSHQDDPDYFKIISEDYCSS